MSLVSRVPTVLPRRITVTRSLIAATSRSLWVMKMMVCPASLQRKQNRVQILDFLRRQQRSRLVEDQGAAALIERAQDLDPLLHADRQVFDQRLWVDAQTVALGGLPDPLLGALAIERDRGPSLPRMTFSVTVKREMSMKCWCTMPSPALDGVARAVEMDWLTIDENLPAVGRVEPEQNVHQRRFAGAVLTEQGVDLPMPDGEIDPIVGDDAGEALDDPAHLDRQWRLRLGLLSHPGLHSHVAGMRPALLGERTSNGVHCNRKESSRDSVARPESKARASASGSGSLDCPADSPGKLVKLLDAGCLTRGHMLATRNPGRGLRPGFRKVTLFVTHLRRRRGLGGGRAAAERLVLLISGGGDQRAVENLACHSSTWACNLGRNAAVRILEANATLGDAEVVDATGRRRH